VRPEPRRVALDSIGAIGPATAALCELILERRPHPEQGFRSCLGIVRLVRPFGAERLEAAARAPCSRGRVGSRPAARRDGAANHVGRRADTVEAADETLRVLYIIAFRLPPIATRNDEGAVPSGDQGTVQDNAADRRRL
jgi:hypothetical protein